MSDNIDSLKKIAAINSSYLYTVLADSQLTQEEVKLLENCPSLKDNNNVYNIHSKNGAITLIRTPNICVSLFEKLLAVGNKQVSITDTDIVNLVTKNYNISPNSRECIIYNNSIIELLNTDKLYLKVFHPDTDFIRYTNAKDSGVILVNNNDNCLNTHISVLAKSLSKTVAHSYSENDREKLLYDKSIAVIHDFNYTSDYDLVADILSQNKKVILVLDKYNNERLINAYSSKIPKYLKLSLIDGLIGSYTYFKLKNDKAVQHNYVANMYNMKTDLQQDNFSRKTIQLSIQLFNTEAKMLLNSSNISVDIPAEDYIRQIVVRAKEMGGSDISLSVGSVPLIRVGATLIPATLKDGEENGILATKVGPNIMARLTDTILTTKLQKETFYLKNQVDAAFSLTGKEAGSGRFRVSIYKQRDSISMSFRILKRMDDPDSSSRALSLKECGVDDNIVKLLDSSKKGIVFFTGPVNTGKSTIMNAYIDHLNRNYPLKIITIEDPIETLHNSKKSLIEQREVGIDCDSFEDGLKQSLRSDPNIINLGEIRTLLAARAAIAAARSGHLVMTTFHTPDSTQTLKGFLQLFPEDERGLILSILKSELVMIYSQQLVPGKDGRTLYPAQEILINNTALKGALSKNDFEFNFKNIIMNSQGEGMRTMDISISKLYLNDLIDYKTATKYAHDVSTLVKLIDNGGGN